MTSARRLLFFAEDRLAARPDGVICALDPGFAAGGWARGLLESSGACLAARTSPTDLGYVHPIRGDVMPLPYYEGSRGLIRTLPKLVLAAFDAAREADVVAVRLPGMIGLVGVLAAVLLRKQLVIEVVGDIREVLDSGVAGPWGGKFSWLAGVTTALAVRQGGYVRYVTENSLQSRYPASRKALVFAFSDVELTSDDFADAAIPPSETPTVVAVGSQEQNYKGHDLLIRSVARLRSEGKVIRLRLLGAGRCQAELRQLATDLGVSDLVDFLGHVSPRSAVMDEVSRAWVFALPSRTEGMPRALIEAMAHGKACLGSRVGGIPELLDEEHTFERNDQSRLDELLRNLLDDGAARRSAAVRNRARAYQLWQVWSFERRRWDALLNDKRGSGV